MSGEIQRVKLLILENDRALRRELEAIFSDLNVTSSETSEQALALVRRIEPDVVLFDLGTARDPAVAAQSLDLLRQILNLAPDKPAVFREIARILKPGGRLAVSDIALKGELPEAIARSMAAYVGCIGGAIRIDDYITGLRAAGFEHVEVVDTGKDLNAYAQVEGQSGCCSPAMEGESCCQPPAESTLHEDLSELLKKYDVNEAAASVKVYAIKPGSNLKAAAPCCGPSCCS